MAAGNSLSTNTSDRPGFGTLIVCVLITLILLLFALNTSLPWEADQPAKAAQIVAIAESNDFTLSHDITDYYRLRLFSLYYAVSGLLYKAIGGPIYRFMNVSSVPLGILFVLSLAIAFQRVFRINVLWTTLTLASMPLFVITFSYGNETASSLSMFALSLALATSQHNAVYLTSAAAYSAAVFCRADVLFLGPFWLIWSVAIARNDPSTWQKRAIQLVVVCAVTGGLLWLLLLRSIPKSDSFEWSASLKLLIAYFLYPFNPTVVLLVVPAWFSLKKQHRLASWSTLLLLVPAMFYIGILSSPKYIAPLIIGYALLVGWLLNQLTTMWRAMALAGMFAWFFVTVSIYGVFGPVKGSQWYLPTADGPCPTGSYFEFYRMARAGVYQVKQAEHTEITEQLFDYLEASHDESKLLGHAANAMISLVEIERKTKLPAGFRQPPTEDGGSFIMVRTGYLNLERIDDEWQEQILKWLKEGRVQGVGAEADFALPTIIKIGQAIPEGENTDLGKRILFMDDRYKGHMVFTLTEFVPDYLPTCWNSVKSSAPPENAIYQDERFYATDEPTEGCTIFGYVWPARYYNQKLPSKF